MSSTELIKGKFVLIPKGDLTVEQLCEKLYKELGIVNSKFEEYYTCYEEALLDECYEKYFVHNDNLYVIIEQDNHSDDSFCEVRMVGLGIYEFMTSFYNGGTCLSEMLDEGLTKASL